MRMVQVKRVRDATGAYCLDCNRAVGEPYQTFPWTWRKSQRLHETSMGHRTIMYRIDYDTSNQHHEREGVR